MNAHLGLSPYLKLDDPERDLTGDVVRLIEWITGSPDPAGRRDNLGSAVEAAEAALISAMHASNMIAEQQARIAQLENLAVTDELTGLNNRRGFESELRRVQSAMRRYDEQGLLLYIDLDGFKGINDTFGHAAGDAVLKRVAELLRGYVRDTDAVARLGGDEFVVLLSHASPRDVMERAEALEHLLNSAKAWWRGQAIQIRASVGVQQILCDASADMLLHEADHAMYDSKRSRSGVTPLRCTGTDG